MFVDREQILKQLERAMNRVAEGNENIARHRKAVAELERDGQDGGLTQKMLKYAEHLQTIQLSGAKQPRQLLGCRGSFWG
jgi:hypothetical protein